MNRKILGLLCLLFLSAAPAFGATPWSTQDYDLYTGDFDGDGQPDLLYIAKAPGNLSGIARGVNGGFDTSFQSWPSNFLGITWSGNQYNVIILQNRLINSQTPNTQADILLQSKTPGGASFLLKPNAQGRIAGVYQNINGAAGQAWTADQHRIIAGDFNNDGLADVFLQATGSAGQSTIVLADANGQFTATSPAQTPWSDGFLGFKWASTEANIYVGDFNGDGYPDLLIQARPQWVMIDFDVPFPVPTYPPNMNGIAFGHAAGAIFQTAAVPGETLGYFAWSRNAFGVDWSPLVTQLAVGNFNGTAYSDILVQALHSGHTSYLVSATGSTSVFGNGVALASNLNWSADTVRLIPGNYSGSGSRTTGVYFQAVIPGGTNTFATNVTGTSVSTTVQDPTAPPPGVTMPTEAGRITANFTVTKSGAATYTIPLWAPPGIGALQLPLALQYSSRDPDGVLGVGWSLGGMSSISRCNKTWAQDGVSSAVTNTAADRYCLDGQQLKSAGSGVYATELESFSSITSSGTLGGGPASFTVTTKNGLIYDYGLSANSQIMAGSTGTVRTWALSQIRDRVGNKITFSYNNDAQNGSYRVTEIDYPVTATAQGPFYSVTFSYGNRPGGAQVPSSYLAGALVQEPNELNAISIQNYGSATPTKVYHLSYNVNPSTSRLRLTGVQECSATSCLPSTTINPQGGAGGWSTTANPAGVSAGNNLDPIPVDLNGDGLTDILYPIAVTSNTVHWWVVFATGTGYGSPVDTTIVTNNSDNLVTGEFSGKGLMQFIAPQGGNWTLVSYNGASFVAAPVNLGTSSAVLPVNGERFAVDYDGDGLPDLVSFVGTNVVVRQNITPPGGAVTFATATTTAWSAPPTGNLRIGFGPGILTTADFNGDGKADLLVLLILQIPGGPGSPTTPQTAWNVLISNGFSGPATLSVVNSFVGTPAPAIGDWNGDGCTDVLSADTIYVSDCTGTFKQINTTVAAGTAIVPVDWDGDGRTDILYNSNNTWNLLRSTGTSYASFGSVSLSVPVSTRWFPVDADGDGLVDLAFLDPNNGGALKYYLHSAPATPPDVVTSFTDGLGMSQSLSYVPISRSNYTKCAGTSSTCPTATFPEADFQGPLYVVNQFTASDGTGSTYQNQFWYYGATVQLQGRGFEDFFARRSVDSRTQLYTYDYLDRAFPYTDMEIQKVVSSSANYISSNLSCASASTHCVEFWQATPASQIITGLGGHEARTFAFQQAITQKNYELGGALDGQAITSQVTQYTYGDGYGNPTNIQTTTTDLDPTSPFSSQTWQTTVANTYLNDTSAWCLGLLAASSVTSSAQGQTPQTRSDGYTPDSNHALCRQHQRSLQPTTSTDPSLLALMATETYSYDSCGNRSRVDIDGYNPDGTAITTRSTQYNYSYFTSRCQFPELITNALLQTVTVSYQYDFGVPAAITDLNGAQTSWKYDDYGRTAQELRPDNTVTNFSFKYCVNAPCWGIPDLRFLVTANELDANGTLYFTHDQFFDGFLRERYDESNRAFGTWTVNDARTYNSLGSVATVSRPFSQGDNGYWVLSYDVLRRPTGAILYQQSSQSAPVARSFGWGYNGRTIQTTDIQGRIRKTVRDVTGHLRRVIDPKPGQGTVPGATTSYDYDDFGNLTTITDAINAVSTAQYNLRGFRTDAADGDSGSWHFNADSLNELISYTDGKGQSIGPYTYDALGRVTRRVEPEGTSSWVWGQTKSLHDIGSLDSVSGYGYSESRTYDGIGRLSTQTITTDQQYQYGFSYNSIGALDTLTYPVPAPAGGSATPTAIKYGYSFGAPVQISDVTTSTPTLLWSLSGVNDYSQPTSESLGTGAVAITSTYTPWTGELVQIQSGTGGSTSNLQNLKYTWDSAGNLSQRQDINQTLTEIFSYDALDRPTAATLNSVPNFSASYTDASGNDLGGNIASRSDGGGPVRNFDYTTQQAGCNYSGLPPQPHAVRNVGGGAFVFCYDKNGNVIQRNGLAFSWSSYNMPVSLQANVGGSTYSSQFLYGPDHQRYQQNATYSNGTEITSYVGGLFEKVTGTAMGGTVNYRHYVPTPSGLTVIINRTSSSTSTTYALGDHLGSADALVSGTPGQVGNLLARESFGVFGQRRAPNWAAGGPSAADWTAIANNTRRGFTFHEELDNISLVHMNGRVYDPNVGRFLSVDPVVGSLENSQSVNPYAYVGNRPLTALDPSGFDGEDIPTVNVICCSSGSVAGDLGDAASAFGHFIGKGLGAIGNFLGGLFGSSNPRPVPPPAAAVQTQTAESGIGVNSCGAPGCGMGLMTVGLTVGESESLRPGQIDPLTGDTFLYTVNVYGTPPKESDIGGNLNFLGIWQITRVDPAPPGADYVEVVTVSGKHPPFYVQPHPIGGTVWVPGEAAAEGVIAGAAAAERSLQAAKSVQGVAGRILSRINITNKGWAHLIANHYFGSSSRFILGEEAVRDLLSSKQVIGAPVVRILNSADGLRYVREVEIQQIIGWDTFARDYTSILTVITDEFGNLVTAFPGVLK